MAEHRELTQAELLALHDASLRRLAVVWTDHPDKYPGLGCKPWFAMTCGVQGSTLHTLWRERLLRLDRSGAVINADGFLVARARLTPLGRRVLEANR